jgi:hypothetical protein
LQTLLVARLEAVARLVAVERDHFDGNASQRGHAL